MGLCACMCQMTLLVLMAAFGAVLYGLATAYAGDDCLAPASLLHLDLSGFARAASATFVGSFVVATVASWFDFWSGRLTGLVAFLGMSVALLFVVTGHTVYGQVGHLCNPYVTPGAALQVSSAVLWAAAVACLVLSWVTFFVMCLVFVASIADYNHYRLHGYRRLLGSRGEGVV